MPRARRSTSDASSARSSASPYPTQSSSGGSSPTWSPDAITPPPEFEAEPSPTKPIRKSRKVRTELQADSVAVRRHMSCENCRIRKSKCSRQSPCTACNLRGETCTWIGPPPAGESGPDALQASLDEVARLKKLVDVLLDRLQQQDRLDDRHNAGQDDHMRYYNQVELANVASGSYLPPFSGLAFPSMVQPQPPSSLDSDAPTEQRIRKQDAAVTRKYAPQHGSMTTLVRAAQVVDSAPSSKVEED